MKAVIWSLPTWFHTAFKALTHWVLVKECDDHDGAFIRFYWHKWDDSKDV